MKDYQVINEKCRRFNKLIEEVDPLIKEFFEAQGERTISYLKHFHDALEKNKVLEKKIKDFESENRDLEERLFKIGKEITSKQFEVYNPLRQLVVGLPEIIAAFDRNGIDIVENPEF